MSVTTEARRVARMHVREPVYGSELYFKSHIELLKQLPHQIIETVTGVLADIYQRDGTLFVFGNGGSAALASHIACDLGKGTAVNGNRRFRVMALTDNLPLITAWANDQHYEDIFAEQLRSLVRHGDAVLAISGSGNSANVLNALQVAREAGAQTLGLTGFQGGRMKLLCDSCIVIPSTNMQLIEDFHVSVAHAIFLTLRQRISKALDVNSES